MKLREILSNKGVLIHSTNAEATLQSVVELLVARNCGSLVVVDSPSPTRLQGIITERDIMRSIAKGMDLRTTRVRDVMTVHVLTARVQDSIEETMGMMTENRIRHLPIIEDDELVGIVSIGDVVKAQYLALSVENHHLKNYIIQG